MRWTIFLIVLVSSIVGSASGWGQDVQRVRRLVLNRGVAPAAPASAEEDRATDGGDDAPGSIKTPIFFLRDGSKVAGEPRFETVTVTTRYGALAVPRAELVRVRFVTRIDPAIKTRVAELIEKLGDPDFDTREQAYAALSSIGPDALEQVRAAKSSPNEEVSTRAELLVEELEEKAEAKKEAVGISDAPGGLKGTLDEVVTTRMVIRGTVELDRIVIGSRYGDLQVDVADLVEVAFQRGGPEQIKLDVLPKHQPNGTWLDTKIELDKGMSFRIEASGNMSNPNYGVSSGPTGATQYSSGNAFHNFPLLSLVGKVGKNGKPFLVGQTYKGKASGSGRLYLSVVPFTYDPGNVTGKYTAAIRLLDR